MTVYQCDRNGNMIFCPACGKGLRGGRVCDPWPFCKRVACLKARVEQVKKDQEKEQEQGGPAN
jgi:hypothetical protein